MPIFEGESASGFLAMWCRLTGAEASLFNLARDHSVESEVEFYEKLRDPSRTG